MSWDAGQAAARLAGWLAGWLAGEGYSVTAIDVSGEAIGQARARFVSMVRFAVADMTQRLSLPDEGFDAVMSNVALHMFPDGVTRAVFAEVGRRAQASPPGPAAPPAVPRGPSAGPTC